MEGFTKGDRVRSVRDASDTGVVVWDRQGSVEVMWDDHTFYRVGRDDLALLPNAAEQGRLALATELGRECDDAKQALLAAIAEATKSLDAAQTSVIEGLGIATATNGEALVLREGRDSVNRLATEWSASEQRRVRLLALYDAVNGTTDAKVEA